MAIAPLTRKATLAVPPLRWPTAMSRCAPGEEGGTASVVVKAPLAPAVTVVSGAVLVTSQYTCTGSPPKKLAPLSVMFWPTTPLTGMTASKAGQYSSALDWKPDWSVWYGRKCRRSRRRRERCHWAVVWPWH